MRPALAWTIAGVTAGAALGIAAGIVGANRDARERMAESARLAAKRMADVSAASRDRWNETGAEVRERWNEAASDVRGAADQLRERSTESIGRALLSAAEARDESLDPLDDDQEDDLPRT